MKIAVLGAAGSLGRAVAQELSRRSEVGELVLVDYVVRDAKRLAKALSPKCRWAMADVGRPPEISRLLEGIDAVASAVGPCAVYEKAVLLACAENRVPAASAGDVPLPASDRLEVDAAFHTAGIPAVSGCGMMPGWTELLAAHFLAPDGEPVRYLFCSPGRFGGYAFLRAAARGIAGPAAAPDGAPEGKYFSLADGSRLGVPGGNSGRRFRWITGTVGRLGPAGRELSAALLLWFRGPGAGDPASAAAVAGVSSGGRRARVEDPAGRLAALTVAGTALLLAAKPRERNGLLPLPEWIGREEAERIAAAAGARIVTT
jgi:NAD(P)-dependent dehydrogenase (short-subunit alcohol dehydrogenase family)